MTTTNFFPSFTTQSISVTPDVAIHTLIGASNGPPLLLVHGFPQTHHIWHLVTPHLIDHFSLVLVDLRGYGESSKPRAKEGGGHAEYSKGVMGEDCLTVMKTLGHTQFSILAHDRGARVAHQLAINHPEAITKMMLLDILPTLTMYEMGKYTWYQKYWHWQFLSQPFPFPESAIAANPELYAEKFLGPGGVGGKGINFHPEVLKIYGNLLKSEEGLHAMCEDYRAGATIDLEEQRRDRNEGRRIVCEVFVVWGSLGACETEFGSVVERWKEVCGEGVIVQGRSVKGGHYVSEECGGELIGMTAIRIEYKLSLARATLGIGDSFRWYEERSRDHTRAALYQILEVQGTLAVLTFLEAIKSKILPEFAETQLCELIMNKRHGQRTATLEDYDKVLPGILDLNARLFKNKEIDATIANTEDNKGKPNNSDTISAKGAKRRSPNKCPCQPSNANHNRSPYSHKWDADEFI